MEVVVTAISSSQIIITNKPTSSFFTGRMPFLSPNQQCQSTEGKISHSMDLLTPSSPGVFNFVSDHQRLLVTFRKCCFKCSTKTPQRISVCLHGSFDLLFEPRIPYLSSGVPLVTPPNARSTINAVILSSDAPCKRYRD